MQQSYKSMMVELKRGDNFHWSHTSRAIQKILVYIRLYNKEKHMCAAKKRKPFPQTKFYSFQ